MSKYLVISGAPTLREIRSGTAPSSPQWRIVRPCRPEDINIGVDSSQDSLNDSFNHTGKDDLNIIWPPSQSQSQSQTQSQPPTQPETFLQTSTEMGKQNRTDSITSTSTASTLLETETFPTRTFRMTNTLPSSQSTSSASSSIAHFPTFHFSLRTLTPLRVALAPVGRGSVKVNLLVAVMDVEGADTITTKAGQETHLLKLVVGDDEGAAGKISVWGETALEWAGAGKMMGLRRGDIVYLSDIQVASVPPDSPTLTASTRQGSGIQLCYRTKVRTDEDKKLQPDLRLASTDTCVRRVATFAEWVTRVV
ncbi:hypothetical protein RSOLAG1IB_00297 [Rhizoctonia solani AG-1 IB]|uniref:Uncharacterized protein n=1 Tax=Thanatephorus cucumeris (strain AG1-IB / isolate 7/3/14) TaxID=1108050 RepID=A0A0B7F6A6_THACB|nr:hypothetical protein RSOLAG1IB_00297 [Rhizoctonia solani AG-1 IB]